MASPLAGITVVDLTRVLAGPYCTMLLGDMGADVIKIERPDGGDDTRGFGPPYLNGESAMFLAINRNKKSITLNLKHTEAKAVFTRLLERADVLVENFRPGTMANLGFDYDAVRRLNPRLIYCSISGFGPTGPYAERGGYDLIAQGMSGIMSATGSDGGAPVKVGVPITDLGAGLFGVFGILCALRARHLTGRGQLVDTSLFEAGLSLSAWEATEYWFTGQVPRGLGTAHRLNAPYHAFRASDGHFTVGAANDNLFPRLCALLGLDHLPGDPRFDSVAHRLENRRALEAMIEAVTITAPRAHWLAKCEAAGVPAGPIYSVPEALDDAHARARGMVQELPHPQAGRVRMLGNPVKMSHTPPVVGRVAPALGEDTDAILAELGLADAEIDGLRTRRVIA